MDNKLICEELLLGEKDFILETHMPGKPTVTKFNCDNDTVSFNYEKSDGIAVRIADNLIVLGIMYNGFSITSKLSVLTNKDMIHLFGKIFDNKSIPKKDSFVISIEMSKDIFKHFYRKHKAKPIEFAVDFKNILTSLKEHKPVKSKLFATKENTNFSGTFNPLRMDDYLLINRNKSVTRVSPSELEFLQIDNRVIDTSHIYTPSVDMQVTIRKILTYNLTEFFARFPNISDLYKDTEKYLKEYLEYGVSYDKVELIIKFLEGYSKHVSSKKNKVGKELSKDIEILASEFKKIQFIYIVRPDGYVHTKSSHDRCGYWRHYKNGKTVWVRSTHVVGKKDKV